MRISCSVVSFNNDTAQIARVLGSVAASEGAADIAMYLMDNSPSDQLASTARDFGAAYMHLPKNLGFGSAHNVAIRASLAQGCAYHLVLNPDIHFDGGVIQSLVEYMDQHPDIGMIMPGIRYPDGQTQHLCKLLPHPMDLFMRRFCPALYRRSGRLSRYEMHDTGYDKIMDVPALSGCFMLLRTAVLRQAGMFDEGYFMYLEDVDLSRRFGRVSRTVYFPQVFIAHEYSKSSYKETKLLLFHIRSALRYFNKWGWFLDNERDLINRAALKKINSD